MKKKPAKIKVSDKFRVEDDASTNPYTATPEDMWTRAETRDAFAASFKSLSFKHQFVLASRYGLNEEGKTYTLESIGQHLGLDASRVSKIEQQAFETLQKKMTVGTRHKRHFEEAMARAKKPAPPQYAPMSERQLDLYAWAQFTGGTSYNN